MQPMLKYITSICFIFCLSTGVAQDKPVDLQPKDTVEYKQAYGLRAGVDLSRILRTQLSDDYSGLEIVADYRLSQDMYIAGELGNENRTKQEDLYNFETSGSYIKLGIDYNTYENWYGMNNTIHIGGRLAYSTFSQTLNDYQYFDSNRYWNPDSFPVGSSEAIEFDNLNAAWLEFVLGLKTELFANIYLGGSIRMGFLVNNKDPEGFKNLYIPGFNKVTDDSNFGIGYNYSITYMIPLYKKSKKKKEPKNNPEPPAPKEKRN